MSRGLSTRVWRSLAVWLAVTAAATAGAVVAPAAWAAVRPGAGAAQFADLLVAACATALLLALVWLWVVTTVTVAELLTGRLRTGGGATRRLVLLACGAAVLAGTTAPALAAGDGSSILAGLSLPDRSVATSEATRRPDPTRGAAPGPRRTARGVAVVDRRGDLRGRLTPTSAGGRSGPPTATSSGTTPT